MKELTMKIFLSLIVLTTLLAGCASTQQVSHCEVSLKSPLRSAMAVVEDRLVGDCGPYYQDYVSQLIEIATDNPSADNRQAFSDLLVSLSDRGVISKRQASNLYNRYFNVKFVSLNGDYSTCSQVCPVQDKVMLDMEQELLDKETGLLKASNDQAGYYRADMLLKESQLVLAATCRACATGAKQ
jgi:hypothetical protein